MMQGSWMAMVRSFVEKIKGFVLEKPEPIQQFEICSPKTRLSELMSLSVSWSLP